MCLIIYLRNETLLVVLLTTEIKTEIRTEIRKISLISPSKKSVKKRRLGKETREPGTLQVTP